MYTIMWINARWFENVEDGEQKTSCRRTDGCGFEPRSEPPSMLADTSVSMWIETAQLPC